MKNKLGRHEQYLPHYFTILLELIYSGVYSKVDVGRIVCSIGILLIALACIQTGKTRALPWLPLIMLGLIIYGVRDKWHLEVAEKNKVVISKAHTKIKAPKEPTLAKCELEPKWNKPKCNADNKELQDTYDLTLKEYNTKIEGSEIKINRVNSNLTFYEQLPVLIYALISGAIAFVAFKTSEPKLSYSRPRENDTNQIKKNRAKEINGRASAKHSCTKKKRECPMQSLRSFTNTNQERHLHVITSDLPMNIIWATKSVTKEKPN